MMRPALPPLALSMGEPAGIGPELAIKAWAQLAPAGGPAFALYADPALIAARAKAMGLDVPIALVAPHEATKAFAHALPVVALGAATVDRAGVLNVANAQATIEAISLPVDDIKAGIVRALVTNPIQKSVLYAAGFKFPGHTEYLGSLADKLYGGPHRAVMMLACDEMRVVPVTVHIALAKVPAALTPQLIIDTATIAARDLARRFGIAHPRIAVAGLNPHAGESGTMGREDEEIVRPAIAQLQAQGMDIRGPLPADTLFHVRARAGYDCVLAMYHDQALIPIKTIAFDRAVNVTLGLPFVRTSPDHGTALDIAGKGICDAGSLIAALHLADRMSERAHGRD